MNFVRLITFKEDDWTKLVQSILQEAKEKDTELKIEKIRDIFAALPKYETYQMVEPRPNKIPLQKKIELNEWDHIEDFIRVYNLMRMGMWSWVKNNPCKYVDLRVDMRDGGCIIKNRMGDRVDPEELEKQ